MPCSHCRNRSAVPISCWTASKQPSINYKIIQHILVTDVIASFIGSTCEEGLKEVRVERLECSA